MSLIKCFQTCSLWGDSFSSLGKILSLCGVAPESQLALFRVYTVLKADPLGAMLKYRLDFIKWMKWTCSPFLEAWLLTANRSIFLRF